MGEIAVNAISRLAPAYPHAPFGEKVVSFVSELKSCRLVFGRPDKSLGNKPIKNACASLDDQDPLDENDQIYVPSTNCLTPTSISRNINMQIYR